ncbi:hypothetical protein F9U64_17580 [Gracilibacillus oryzae]|uniref:Uncharacterized protein n=1 Tax=Gracilibacillus oryzae TaxID=1672701 RepID=A0A7C8GRW1_9BACI|nr:hypothetical protein [Gracilibacillus oryzae]KAB8127458.1 hypothetical protein F9U64_17580 [Gracilibacillus oryzae]
MDKIIYISDNFFSAGKTSIRNAQNEEIGMLDLKSAFKSNISVFDNNGSMLASGKFRPFSSKWIVYGPEQELGILKQKLFSFSKTYYYTTKGQDTYIIHSPAFSRDFTIRDKQENAVATFKRMNHFFSSPAFEINNTENRLQTEELICVVMGVNAIEKSNNAAAANAGT